MTGLITNGNENGFRDEVNLLLNWWPNDNNLTLNVDKSKELVIDFRRNETLSSLIVKWWKRFAHSNYVHYGLFLLEWNFSYWDRDVKHLELLINVYRAIIESILTRNSLFLVWFWGFSRRDLDKLKSIIRNAESIIGTYLPSALYGERSLKCEDNIGLHKPSEWVVLAVAWLSTFVLYLCSREENVRENDQLSQNLKKTLNTHHPDIWIWRFSRHSYKVGPTKYKLFKNAYQSNTLSTK